MSSGPTQTMVFMQSSRTRRQKVLEFFTEQLEELGLTQTQYKAVAHPAAAEAEAVNHVVTFSSVMDTPILIVHVSVQESIAVIWRAQTALKPVFAQTCPQYLLLGKKRLSEEHFCGAKYICSPPLRSDPEDVEAIWRGILNGPYRFSDPQGKQLGRTCHADGTTTERFTKVPNGLRQGCGMPYVKRMEGEWGVLRAAI